MTTNEQKRAEVLAADEARYQALYVQDIAALEQMLVDDYVHIHANGKTEDKAAFLATIRAARYRFVQAERSEQLVRQVGPVTILSGNTRTTINAGGELKTLGNAFVTVWSHASPAPKLVHWQATKLPEA